VTTAPDTAGADALTSIHVITNENRAKYDHILEQQYRLRHKVFVGERGWDNLKRADGRDMDRYDNANAIYLLAIDNDRVVGGLRLYPTLLPHMLSETFSHLATANGVLRAANVFECTRYFIVRERRTGRTDCRLLAAFQEFCLQEGLKEVTAVVEMWWLPRWQQAGFKVRPLGLPTMIEGEPCFAAAIEISEQSLSRIRQVGGLRGTCLTQNGIATPILPQVFHVAA
jgi:acyl-homoserine lactone synthase